MALIARLNDFQPNAVIRSQQLDDEFNQIVNMLSGVTNDKEILVKSAALSPTLILSQFGSAPILSLRVSDNPMFEALISGGLKINSSQLIDAPGIGINNDVNNLAGVGIVAVFQTTGSGQQGLRLAMEGTLATSSNVPALTVTRSIGGGVQTQFRLSAAGKVEGCGGHPSVFANVPAKRITLGGTYNHNFTAAGNGGAIETDMHTRTIEANILSDDGDSFQVRYSGTFANNGANKRIRGYFGGTVYFDSGAVAFQNGSWSLLVDILRTSTTTAIVSFTFGVNATSGNVGYAGQLSIAGPLDYTAALIAKVTGQATSNNDIVQNVSIIRKYAMNNT